MTEPIADTVLLDPQREQSLRTAGTISYLLHAVVAVGAVIPSFQPSVLLLVFAVILDMVKRDEAAGSWQASHIRWRLSSVISAGVMYLITVPLWFLFVLPGWIAWGLISLWFLYRIVVGWSAMNAGRAIS
ncbi:DUF4870 family protein [Roseateles sp. PN1]|uniref:DUF4870 family protein n=1 Tax=Roseateles sp. PN1 TaxID=3137372 RepID=UPI003138BE2E